MSKKIIKNSEGYKNLQENNFSTAMMCFIETLINFPLLKKIQISSIMLTQRYYRKNAKYSMGEGLIINEIDNKNNDDIIFKDGFIEFNGQNYEISENNLCNSLINFVTLNPGVKVTDFIVSPNSLLLGLMYRVIWKAKVRVNINKNSSIEFDEYLENYASSAVLVGIVSNLNDENYQLIKYLGNHSNYLSKRESCHWPRQYTQLGEIYKDLVNSNSLNFLEKLFEKALGRSIQEHENKYFREKLENNNYKRLDVVKIICNGEEYLRHIKKEQGNTLAKQKKYQHPQKNEISINDIDIPYFENPKVSVLIPVYGKIEYTLACLKSISENIPKVSFEVIVMDDNSPDNSIYILRKVKNIKTIINPENLGFLRSCNNGAKNAKGEYLLFLNNDTRVMNGWLDRLLETFKNFPNCGLAGSKFIYPDGLLQEAGGIVWQDGSAWNYGSRQDPNKPEFNYAREVDYISGASIMVPSELFTKLGGFDEYYAPAYYEDTDLALRIRKLQKSVIYQPLSEVVHFEGISSGTDTSSGVKSYQVINSKKFLQRWKNTLINHRSNGVEPHLERDRNVKGRVLFIDACTPTPDQDSGSIDIYNLMKVFVQMGWVVTFIPEDNYAYMDRYTADLQKLGVQALYYPYIKSVDEHINLFGNCYDLVMAFRPSVTQKHIVNIRKKCPKAKIIFNTVDLHFLRLEREAEIKKDFLIANEGHKLKKIELELMKQVDLTTVVSSTEFEILKELNVERVVHLPFSREISPSKVPFESRSGLIFVGGFQHNPNIDAVKYFVFEIMPLLRKSIPDLVFNIAGSNTPNEIYDLACNDIKVHGFVEDLEYLLSTMRLNVAPLRYGAGTKGKVVQALSNSLPTVGTTIAFEGMNMVDMLPDLVANTPKDFSKAILQIYQSSEKWDDASRIGLSIASQSFGISALSTNISKILSDL